MEKAEFLFRYNRLACVLYTLKNLRSTTLTSLYIFQETDECKLPLFR